MRIHVLPILISTALAAIPRPVFAQVMDSIWTYSAHECPDCAAWNAAAPPVRLFGSTYYVGTRGLSALLISSPDGHVLIDAGIPESAPLIMANVRALGFRVEDIRLIVHSHAHFDHVGGIASLQRASGADVVASPASAVVLGRGRSGPDDPQYGGPGPARGKPGIALAFPPVSQVREIANGDTVRVGSITLTAHFTPGHTPGGTSWSWRACEGGDCVSFVYADSQTPVSADGFLFTRSTTYPGVLADFDRGLAVLETLPCDVIVTPHPGASRLWDRLEARDKGTLTALRDAEGCRRYAAGARRRLSARIESERAK